jgi:hypothetical protein
MLLVGRPGEERGLYRPGDPYPDLQQYRADPKRYPHVISEIPAGTEFTLVGIKEMGLGGHTTYVSLAGDDEWIGIVIGEYTPEYRLRYNREYFRKL